MGSVEDHLYPLTHFCSHLSAFSNHQDTSASFSDCQGPYVPIDTCLELSGPSQHASGHLSYICRKPPGPINTSSELSVCIRQPSGHISYTQGRTVRVLSSEVQCISSRVFLYCIIRPQSGYPEESQYCVECLARIEYFCLVVSLCCQGFSVLKH